MVHKQFDYEYLSTIIRVHTPVRSGPRSVLIVMAAALVDDEQYENGVTRKLVKLVKRKSERILKMHRTPSHCVRSKLVLPVFQHLTFWLNLQSLFPGEHQG